MYFKVQKILLDMLTLIEPFEKFLGYLVQDRGKIYISPLSDLVMTSALECTCSFR